MYSTCTFQTIYLRLAAKEYGFSLGRSISSASTTFPQTLRSLSTLAFKNSFMRVLASLETKALNNPEVTSLLIAPSFEVTDATSNLKSISSFLLFMTLVWHVSINFVGYLARFASVVNSRTFLSTSFPKEGLSLEKLGFLRPSF